MAALQQDVVRSPVQGFEYVASISSVDAIAALHIEALLRLHGIRSLYYSTEMGAVFVPLNDRIKASRILDRDARDRPYDIFIQGGGSYRYPSEAAWPVVERSLPYRRAIRVARVSGLWQVSAVLVQPTVRVAARSRSHVKTVRVLRRSYVDHDLRWKSGYIVEVELDGPQEMGQSLGFEVWHGGRDIADY